MAETKKTDAVLFAEACQAGGNIFSRMVSDGVDITDEDEFGRAFGHAVSQHDIDARYVGAAWSVCVDRRIALLESEGSDDSDAGDDTGSGE